MNVEHLLLSRIYAEGTTALGEALERGIGEDHFTDPVLGRVWAHVITTVEDHEALPSVTDVQMSCDTDWYPDDEVEDSLSRLIELAHEGRKYALGLESIRAFKDELKEDPSAAWNLIREKASEAEDVDVVLKPVNVHDNWVEWFDSYWEGDALTGIPTGFPTIDYATGGLQPEQLVTIIGTPKAGKSTLLLKMAHTMNTVYGKRIYFVTFEMTEHEQRQRLACMIAKVDYARLRDKTLNPLEVKALRRALGRMEDVMPDFHMATDISAGTTVAALTNQARKFDPDVVIVDGVYLMDSGVPDVQGMDPKALTAITRNLKRMAQHLRKPVVISHQALESRYAKTKGLRSGDVGYSSSFAQDSDVMLGIEHPTEDDVPERRLSIMLARAAAKRSTVIDWDWTTSTFEEVEGYEESMDEDEPWEVDDV